MSAAQPAPVSPLSTLASALPPEVYRQVVDQADIAISITDPKARILFANEAFTRTTGYSADEIVGKNESVLSNHTTPPEIYKAMWTSLVWPWTVWVVPAYP